MTSKRFHRLFLPVGLALAILLGLAWPAPGSQVATASLAGLPSTKLVVALVFLLSGLLMKNAEMTFGAKFFKSLALVCLVNLAGGFALALWVAPLFPLKAGAALGLTVILCAPTTLSSAAVIARQSGGNSAWALGLTAVLTVVGTLLMPWMLGLGWAMGADATLGLALGLAGLVLIPLGAGLALRQTLKLPPWGGLLPSGGIILVVWMSSSLHHQELAENSLASIGLWAIAALSLHGALLALAWLASRSLPLTRPEWISFLFVASQKTLPLSLAAILSMGLQTRHIAPAIAFCVVFHYAQILADSLLGSKLAQSK